MYSRRQLLRLGALAGGMFLSSGSGSRPALAAIPGGTLKPESIPKYRLPLIIPPAMPRTGRIGGGIDYYEIAVRQFRQQILPPNLPMTDVWSYGSVNHPATFNYPAFTIEAGQGVPVRVRWINGLVKSNGEYLTHLLPVDPTLHWANPPDGIGGRDMRPMFSATPGPYPGPVPIVTHVHGAHTFQESDGYPEAWYLPNATNIPAGYARTGTVYDEFIRSSPLGGLWTPPGNSNGLAASVVFEYPNDQRATTLWYHDHTLGITRLNVYAGPAGFYNIRGGPDDLPVGVLPGPAPGFGTGPFYELPIVIQDRSFNRDGSLFYSNTRECFDGYDGPYIPETPVSPIWNPEFFGDSMVVNGRTWPVLQVEPRRYRFRFLNGCNSRFLILRMVAKPPQSRGPSPPALPFWQIGSDGGFLPKGPVELEQVLLGPAERADVIIDFTGLHRGTRIYLSNVGPDEPFGGGEPGMAFEPAEPLTTGQVMLFEVGPLLAPDPSIPPEFLGLPDIPW